MSTAIKTFPIHGQHKLISEGFRTRDGHMIEWFSKKLRDVGSVEIYSRPEPVLVSKLTAKYDKTQNLANTVPIDTVARTMPPLRDRKRWWVKSADFYPDSAPSPAPSVIWNPLLGLSKSFESIAASSERIVFDLLDDWTVHHHFSGIRDDVDSAYKSIFDRADIVTANSEGTVSLAERYGRDDVRFVANGCDPDRFNQTSLASGPIKIGYVGKIGKRLDTDLIKRVSHHFQHIEFIFAGPVLDRETGRILAKLSNVKMLGDVHYRDVPTLLQQFDIGWVPHNVGEYEVGGDVIKTYEYCAAHLPVLSTPLIGAGSRGLAGVSVVEAGLQIEWIEAMTTGVDRVARVATFIPEVHTWSHKADILLDSAGVGSR